MKEAWLEPVLRRMRIAKVLPVLKQYPGCRPLDIGCGWDATFLRTISPYIESGVGVDFKAPILNEEKLRAISARLDDRLPFDDQSFDVVSMLAVLEHLEHAEKIVQEIKRVLRVRGTLMLTVPSKSAKPVLEFLAYWLKIISEDEIRDHKRYYNRGDLYDFLHHIGFIEIEHRYFQLGMNNFCLAKKP